MYIVSSSVMTKQVKGEKMIHRSVIFITYRVTKGLLIASAYKPPDYYDLTGIKEKLHGHPRL